MKQHKHAEVLRAIADGMDVECSFDGLVWWSFLSNGMPPSPLSDAPNRQGHEVEWRVKQIEEYQVVYSVGEHNYLSHQWYVSKEEFDNFYIPVKGEAKFICFVKETGRERSSIK